MSELLFWSTWFPGAEKPSCVTPLAQLLISNSLCFLDCLFRLQPSTISTIWTPNSDAEAPSDSHLLHHQPGRGVRRVSQRTAVLDERVFWGFTLFIFLFNHHITLVLLPVDFTPCEGTPHCHYFSSKTFSSPTKGQMTLSLRGHLQNSPSDVRGECKIQHLKLETCQHISHISDTLAQNSHYCRTWGTKQCS